MSWFSTSSTSAPNAGLDTSSFTLVSGEPTPTQGTFVDGSNVRVVQPWTGRVPASVVPMSLKITSGNAAFALLSQVPNPKEAKTTLSELNKELVLAQGGQESAPDRVYRFVFMGNQHYMTTESDGQISSQPTLRDAEEVEMELVVNGKIEKKFSFLPLTSPADRRPGRVQTVVIKPQMGKQAPEVEISARVDATCRDRCGDAADCCFSSIGAAGRAVGSSLYNTGRAMLHPRETGAAAVDGTRRAVAFVFNLQVPETESATKENKSVKSE